MREASSSSDIDIRLPRSASDGFRCPATSMGHGGPVANGAGIRARSHGDCSSSDDSDRTREDFSPAMPSRPRQRRALSDGVLGMPGSPVYCPVLLFDRESVKRHAASLPAILVPPSPGRRDERPPMHPQAHLVIPRTISEYLEICRYARSHTEGLLTASTVPSGCFIGCKQWVPRALSEGLLGGRLMPGALDESRGKPEPESPHEAPPPPPKAVEELREGLVMEGKIAELRDIGFMIEVGAMSTGLLRHQHCQGVPRRLLRCGQILSNLVVVKVDKQNRRFQLALRGVDGTNVQEEAYDEVLSHIADWAGVPLTVAQEASTAVLEPSASSGKSRGRGRGKGDTAPATKESAGGNRHLRRQREDGKGRAVSSQRQPPSKGAAAADWSSEKGWMDQGGGKDSQWDHNWNDDNGSWGETNGKWGRSWSKNGATWGSKDNGWDKRWDAHGKGWQSQWGTDEDKWQGKRGGKSASQAKRRPDRDQSGQWNNQQSQGSSWRQ